MAGGRGLSVEEKRAKLLEIFHESKDFFQLKELEKHGAKKGVVSQTVKEVLQTLVDDNLVEFDKIGSANFYWSFPSARGRTLGHKLEKAREEVAILEARQQELTQAIETGKTERQESGTRRENLAAYAKLKESVANAKMEIAQYESANSGRTEEKKRAVILATEAAHRWTDNVGSALAFCAPQASMTIDDLRKAFEISENFDDLPAS